MPYDIARKFWWLVYQRLSTIRTLESDRRMNCEDVWQYISFIAVDLTTLTVEVPKGLMQDRECMCCLYRGLTDLEKQPSFMGEWNRWLFIIIIDRNCRDSEMTIIQQL